MTAMRAVDAQVGHCWRWRVGACEAGRILWWRGQFPPGLEGEWFGQFFQASLCLKIGFSLEQRWKYLARSSYSVFVAWHWNSPMCKPTKHMPCCRQKGHLVPISLYQGAGLGVSCLLHLGWGWDSLPPNGRDILPEKVQKREALRIWRI